MKSEDSTRTWLRRISLAAGIAFTATAEYELAITLGAHPVIAVMLPLAIDAYVVAALKFYRGLDIALSLALMGAAQVAAHLLDARVMTVNIPMVVVVSLLVPVAIWRTHALARTEDGKGVHSMDIPAPEYAAAVERVPVPEDAPPVPDVYPAIEARVPAVPEAVPAGVRLLPIVARPAAPEKVPAVAAAEARTRPEVHAEYVPEQDSTPPAVDDPWDSGRTELGWAAQHFKDELLAGQMPSIRTIKERLSVGQDKAKELQEGFRQAQSAWQLAGSAARP